MTSTMLQRQNVNLQGSLQQARRRLGDSEAQLRTASDALAARVVAPTMVGGLPWTVERLQHNIQYLTARGDQRLATC